jgi:zinc transport system substrate-binding protein
MITIYISKSKSNGGRDLFMKKSQIRFSFILAFFMVSLLLLSACNQKHGASSVEGESGDADTKITVYTSIYPLYDFAVKIAGDRAEVVNLVPPGAKPHDFEPTPRDLIGLSEANVFIYNGSGFETWIEDVLEAIDTSKMIVVNTSEKVDLLTREQTGDVHEEHGKEEGHGEEVHHEEDHHDEAGDHAEKHEHEHGHGEGIYDPHIWLDPVRAKDIAAAIKEALIQADHAGKETYASNFNKVAADLDALHAEYEQVVQNAQRKEIIVSHAAYGYLADRYGIEQIAISGLTPSDEPTQKELQEIIAFAKEHNVKYILFETLVSSKVAEMVKQQIGAESLVLNPLEGLTEEEMAQGKDYFSVMRDNLQSLKKALGSES